MFPPDRGGAEVPPSTLDRVFSNATVNDEGPFPIQNVTIGVDRSRIGVALTENERRELTERAREGLESLRALTPVGARSFGAEVELTMVDSSTGFPFGCGPAICEAIDPDATTGGFVTEYGKSDVEINLPPIVGNSANLLSDLANQASAHIAYLSSFSAHWPDAEGGEAGARPVLVGILPSIMPEHLTREWIAEYERYYNLEEGLRDFAERHINEVCYTTVTARGKFSIRMTPEGLAFEDPRRRLSLGIGHGEMVRYNSLNTSVQYHWGVEDPSNYVRDHRIADLITPIMVALSACSPLVLGYPTGVKESRVFLLSNMLHPNRVFLSDSWISEPLGQFADALRVDPILHPQRGGKNSDGVLTPLRILLEHGKTVWPLNRTVAYCDQRGGTRELRIEHRPISSGPTIQDMIGNAALFYGLMSGMPEYLQRKGIDFGENTLPENLERVMPYPIVNQNLFSAAVDGIQARIAWLNGEKAMIRELMERELLGVAREGLRELKIPDGDIERYLGFADGDRGSGVIGRRIKARLGEQVGVTPSDIIRVMYANSTLGDRRETCARISLRLADMLAAGLGGEEVDILSWFESRNRMLEP